MVHHRPGSDLRFAGPSLADQRPKVRRTPAPRVSGVERRLCMAEVHSFRAHAESDAVSPGPSALDAVGDTHVLRVHLGAGRALSPDATAV